MERKCKMSPRRSSFQITIELLTAISNGQHKPTRLMYECNLSWVSLKNTLNQLESKELIEEVSNDPKHKQYYVTGRGREMLGYYTGLQGLMQV
jgi:predicted transcriptional regulator